MRFPCPLCGDRDLREFTYGGNAVQADRPAPDAAPEVWADWLHLRDNPAGASRELWQHTGGCGAWLVIDRDTVSHAVAGARLPREVAR